jgi:hypothetical protein
MSEREPSTWDMNEEEFRAVTALAPGERYNHFVKRVAEWERVWVLASDTGGLVQNEDDEGRGYLAVWPHPRYAEACATDEWAATEPAEIGIDEWTIEVLPSLAAEGTMLVVFPTPDQQGFVVPPEGMKEDIESELSLYELGED